VFLAGKKRGKILGEILEKYKTPARRNTKIFCCRTPTHPHPNSNRNFPKALFSLPLYHSATAKEKTSGHRSDNGVEGVVVLHTRKERERGHTNLPLSATDDKRLRNY